MEMTILAFSLAVLCLVSWTGTRAFIHFAGRRGILDIPNARSSHSIPTPRGGGVVFVTLFLLFTLMCLFVYPDEAALWRSLLPGGAAVAFIGWMDDRRKGIPVRVRLLVHAAAAVWVLYQLGGMPTIAIRDTVIHIGFFGHLLAFIGGIWVTNLYNFMDGIDGLAAGEGVMVACAASVLIAGYGTPASFALLAFAACIAGFLIWNRPPARVFMGDVGSYFIGFVFFVFALYGKSLKFLSVFSWASLLSVFVIDATYTLIKRFLEKKNLTESHREHLYQQAVIAGFSHRTVTAAALTVTFLSCLAVYLDNVRVFLTFCLVYSAVLALRVITPLFLRARARRREG